MRRHVDSINPAVNPVMYDDEIICGDSVFTCRTNMSGRWNVREGGTLVAEDLPSQAALCRWLIERGNEGAA